MRTQFKRMRGSLLPFAVIVFALLGACNGDNGEDPPQPTDSPTRTESGPTATTGIQETPGTCDPGDGPPGEGAGAEGVEGRITYVRLVFGCQPDVYIMNADGSGATALTDHPALDDESDLSPDG